MTDASNGAEARKKRIAIMGISSVLLVAMVAAVAVGVTEKGGSESTGKVATSQRNVDMLCQSAEHKETCMKSVEKLANDPNADMKTLIKTAFTAAAEELSNHLHNSSLQEELAKDPNTKPALDVCWEVFDYAVRSINASIDKMDEFDLNKINEFAYDLKVWLNGAITLQKTCLDAFENKTSQAAETMKRIMQTGLEMSDNALDIVEGFTGVIDDLDLDNLSDLIGNDLKSAAAGGATNKTAAEEGATNKTATAEGSANKTAAAEDATNKTRKLLAAHSLSPEDGIPTWMSEQQRKLIQVGPRDLKPNVVVAQDGTGQFRTLTEALKTVPFNNNKPFIIYVKAGVYPEYVIINCTMSFLTIIGDGADKTKFVGNKNQKAGAQTFHSATVAVNAANFMAVDIGFVNTAGKEVGPAVALRITGDKAIVFRCTMDGHQDTLYPNSFRQFYRDCTIYGTIDFVFGDAVAVFQNCTILMRRGVDGQEAVVAAGGKDKENGPTALVFHACRFLPDPSYLETPAVKSGQKVSYLARPWKKFAKTVILESFIHEIFNPLGYIPFTGEVNEPTCTALEFNNMGPAANGATRVKWPGVNARLTHEQAAQYYPGNYFQVYNKDERDSWIVASGVPYSFGPMAMPARA